jgi:hypothetical protein
VHSVVATAVLLFGLGLGWSFSFLAASSELADRTLPHERGRLLGFSDQLSGALAATLAITFGLLLDRVGVTALAAGSSLVVLLPAVYLALHRSQAPVRALALEIDGVPAGAE